MNPRRLSHLLVIVTLFMSIWVAPSVGQAQTPGGTESLDTGASESLEVGGKMAGDAPAIPYRPFGQDFSGEVEPNNTPAEATPLGGSDVVFAGDVYPNADVDYFSFAANAGDRVYAAVMTSASANASTDSTLRLYDSDGTTELESDLDNGTFGGLSSVIAGTTLPAAGVFYLQVSHFSVTGQLRPYRLYVRVQSGLPEAEVEPNNVTPQPLPVSGWVSGSTADATDVDLYSLNLNAGDTVFAAIDLDPERDNVEWNAQLGLGPINAFYLVANDAGSAGPDAEAFFITVKEAGSYNIIVIVPSGADFGTYHLSVSVRPAAVQVCTTYLSTNVPVVIPDGPGMVESTLTIPGNPRIGDLQVSLNLTHASMPDLDVILQSPAGNQVALFTDVGSNTQTEMNLTLDDAAGIPLGTFGVVKDLVYQPELNSRLNWFDGMDAGGEWRLRIYDDVSADGGTLNGWSLTVCENPAPPPVCPAGTELTTVYSSDFEAGDGGFTHTGVQDEWEYGLPAFDPIQSCNSGANCWKTDLDGTYNVSSSQDLLSPNINLAGYTHGAWVRWAQKTQMESASFDHASVTVRQVGGANPIILWQWLDATQTALVGNPAATINQSSGWGQHTADISAYLGQNIELNFHLDSDTTVNLAGYAVDDVSVLACAPLPAIELQKTVGTDPTTCAVNDSVAVLPGTEVTYCFEVTNTGSVALTQHTLEDSELGTILSAFPYTLAPGASAFITSTAFITQNTVNSAMWTSFNPGPSDVVIARDVATVTMLTAINVSPTSLSSAQPVNATFTQMLEIGNQGGIGLDWQIVEAVPLVAAASPGVLSAALAARPPQGADGARGGAPEAVSSPAVIESSADFSQGFDDITNLPGWVAQNNSAPLGLTNWFQGNAGVFPAHSGDSTAYIAANFNNTSGAGIISNWLLTPKLPLRNGDTFSFWTRTPSASVFPDRLQVRLSTAGASANVGAGPEDVGDFTTLLLDINPALTVGGYPDAWTKYTITLNGLPLGSTGRLAFRYFVTNSGPSGANSNYIGIDTVEFSSPVPAVCELPADIPWASVNPANGSVPASSSQQVQVTFDSSGLPLGTYTGVLCINSSDPVNPWITVPLTLKVDSYQVHLPLVRK